MVSCSLKVESSDSRCKDNVEKPREHYFDQPPSTLVADSNWEEKSLLEDVKADPTRIIHTCKSIRHDYVERNESQILSVTIYAKGIERETLEVIFEETMLTVTLRSSDQSMIKQFPFLAEKNNYLQWTLALKGQIVPEKCITRLSLMNLELKLEKVKSVFWGSLLSNGLEKSPAQEVQTETWIPLAARPFDAQINCVSTDIDQVEEKVVLISAPKVGYTGLANLGNTCYMNAVLQCLANTTPLRNHFLDKRFQSELNMENPLGFHGTLAISFALLIRMLWGGKKDSVEPSHLKTVLSKRASQFSGYAQHDAQEFMAFLLDGLHEDLNRVKTKPYTAAVESDGREDAVVADEAWRVYQMRNDSIIVDLFQGQYRSTLICPACHKISVTFDPFLYLALPLPSKKTMFDIVLFFKDLALEPCKVTLMLDENLRIKQLKDELKRRFAMNDCEIRLIEVQNSLIKRFFVDEDRLSMLRNVDTLLAFETLAPSPDYQVVDIAIVQRVLAPPCNHSRCAACKKEKSSQPLKRCTKCFDVAYCDQTCQKNHWDVHKVSCREKPTAIAHPFVISLPKHQLTYANIYENLLAYSKFSVHVTPIYSNQDMEPSASEKSPLFFIKPINSQGQGIAGRERLQDRGDVILEFPSPVFLALDWRNNERSRVHCNVESKPLQYREIEWSSDDDAFNCNRVTLKQCLEQFMQSETLSQEEAWFCPKCREHREATKQMSLWRLPEMLIVQLKRFSFRNLMWREKIDKKVDFPIKNLDLSPYLSHTNDTNAIYDLFAVVNHYGGIFSGHYTAFARCSDTTRDQELGWRCMDDRYVQDISESEVVTSAAYLLFYQRRKDAGVVKSPDELAYSNPDEVD